jgi:hypothetical protein
MVQSDILKPIKIFGYCVIMMGVVGILMHFILQQDDRYTVEFMYFTLIVSFFHFFVGVGIISKNYWGYFFFKFYLYLLSIGFPVGTYVAIKMLKYIEKYDVKKFFEKRA